MLYSKVSCESGRRGGEAYNYYIYNNTNPLNQRVSSYKLRDHNVIITWITIILINFSKYNVNYMWCSYFVVLIIIIQNNY